MAAEYIHIEVGSIEMYTAIIYFIYLCITVVFHYQLHKLEYK